MHSLQRKILDLTEEQNLGELTLRGIGELLGEASAQKVKHHLQQLEKRGLIRVDKINRLIEKRRGTPLQGLLTHAQLLAVPIVGSANAGPATLFAEQHIEGYLRISSTFLGGKTRRRLFALKVVGPSMNRAVISDKRIEDGDFAIIDPNVGQLRDGALVLSVIDGMANIKRFYHDKENQQIVLLSESTYNFPPIYIHETDDFLINGRVIQIIKKPKK